MTKNTNRLLHFFSCTFAVALVSGCASFAVSDDILVQRTGFALGLEPSQFTISNRMDEGTTTRYQVKTTSGQQYNCFVGGSVNVLGKSVSDAICTETGKGAASGSATKPTGNCNALLKAAGKC
ncbi:hypothetical protein [Pseudoxanthomonas sp. CF125]|uniref:hypothetical protein n=1 Tax=Pseudoxanthomonas sp. CF125 TaxID=1855303 RepID=UPI000886A850|nr:hypothetical protein [Pseudoxanthomonas sp. CF125]SDQ81737.1 hypothetical protein SAMN05216569_2169 [Pseudoxanthomonas sp. CF125]